MYFLVLSQLSSDVEHLVALSVYVCLSSVLFVSCCYLFLLLQVHSMQEHQSSLLSCDIQTD